MIDQRSFRVIGSAILLAGLGAAAGLILGYWRWQMHDPPPYPVARSHFVHLLAEQHGTARTLVLGDSLSEQTDLSDVCGDTFNGGVGGAQASTLLPIARDLLPIIRPHTIVVNVGTNNYLGFDDGGNFARDYHLLLESLPRDRNLILFGIRRSAAATAIIRQEAVARNALFVPPIDGPGLIDADDIHLSAAGSRRYAQALAAACRHL